MEKKGKLSLNYPFYPFLSGALQVASAEKPKDRIMSVQLQ